MELKIFQMLEFINQRLANIEKNISRIDEKLDFSVALQRNHLIRVKNGSFIDDTMILMGRPYNDLSPIKAYEIYSNPNIDFIILDVSAKEYTNRNPLPEAVNIPYENLEKNFVDIPSKTIPILVISEDGTRSILACELLVKKGFFNVNNISGGHEFWPERKRKENNQIEDVA